MNIKFIEIKYGSDLFKEQVRLRTKVLREPLGLKFTEQELAFNHNEIHLAILVNDKVEACLILSPLNNEKIKMRQVAVSGNLQKLGLGRILVEKAEEFARKLKYSEMVLNARISALGFYLKLGYEELGLPNEEIQIPHQKMRKRL